MVDPSSPRDLVKRLGTFLADLTMDRPPGRIHADILDHLRHQTQDPDPQLAGIYLDEKDFSSVWTAIRNGASLPGSSWDTVVLPVIVFYSNADALKANLQIAIHHWGTARTALSTPDDPAIPGDPATLDDPAAPAIVPVYEVIPEDTLDTLSLPPAPPIPAEPAIAPPSPRRPRRRPWLIAGSVMVAALLVPVAVVILDKQPSGGLTESPDRSTPSASTPFQPSADASPSDMPGTPTPTSAPSSPGMMPPTAPRSLAVTRKTQTTVTLTWQVPANPGNGLSHYRIFRGMTDTGTVTGTTHTVTGLSPSTGYTFTVKAYDSAGLVSPSSNSVQVTTRATLAGLKLAVKPDSPIQFGTQFTVSGLGWPCTSPATVEIYLDGFLVARRDTDGVGNFSEDFIPVVDASSARIPIIDTSDYVHLEHGTMAINVILRDQMQCTPIDPVPGSITFT